MTTTEHSAPTEGEQPEFVRAEVIARRYSISSRYVLKLAAAGTLPCIRIGPKAVRFSEAAVAEVLNHGKQSP